MDPEQDEKISISALSSASTSTAKPSSSTSTSTATSVPTSSVPFTSSQIADELDPELDALLDDALEDFDKPPPPLPKKFEGMDNAVGFLTSMNSSASKSASASKFPQSQDDNNDDFNQVWSEEFIREATAQFEKKMREYVNQQASAATSKSTPKAEAVGETLQKVVEAATSAAIGSSGSSPAGLAATLNDAIKNVNQRPDVLNNPMDLSDDELAKLMGSIGLGMGDGELDDADMNSFLPFMTNMMQKLLSKELLHPVLSDIVDRYPDWLADNREKIKSADYEKYNQQYEYMRRICVEYSNEKESDTEEAKSHRFDLISDLMLKVQYIGPPPSDLVGDMNPNGLAGLDPSIASQCTLM